MLARCTSTTSSQLQKQQGIGSRVFRFSLLLLAGAFLMHAVWLVYIYRTAGPAMVWARYLHNEAYYDFALHCVLAFAAMAMWSESQIERVRELGSELDKLRRDATQSRDLDRLTGLLNQAALALRIESPLLFEGVVVVCDMDNFKDVNDCYGHLVGDEILRNIGNLLKASIRKEDEAFRWGGDEFVILFHNQCADVAEKRMARIGAAPARFPRARIRRAADRIQLGDRRINRPQLAGCARRSRPQHVRAQAHARRGTGRKYNVT